MLFAGLTLKEDKYIEFAAQQCIKMYRIFLDPEYGVLHQSRGFCEDKETFSEDHWSRGNGWGYLGMADLLEFMPKSCKYYDEFLAIYREFSANLIRYQNENGLWRQELTLESAWEESSGSALILYGLGTGMRLGILDKETYWDVFVNGLHGLLDHCLDKEFATYKSCPGCLCPAVGDERGTIRAYVEGKQPEKDEVHSYGSLMLAFYEAYKNGIEDLPAPQNESL